MISVEQVPMWSVDRGIGHVVAWCDYANSRVFTACGVFGNLPEPTGDRPKRICRKCRENLKRAKLSNA